MIKIKSNNYLYKNRKILGASILFFIVCFIVLVVATNTNAEHKKAIAFVMPEGTETVNINVNVGLNNGTKVVPLSNVGIKFATGSYTRTDDICTKINNGSSDNIDYEDTYYFYEYLEEQESTLYSEYYDKEYDDYYSTNYEKYHEEYINELTSEYGEEYEEYNNENNNEYESIEEYCKVVHDLYYYDYFKNVYSDYISEKVDKYIEDNKETFIEQFIEELKETCIEPDFDYEEDYTYNGMDVLYANQYAIFKENNNEYEIESTIESVGDATQLKPDANGNIRIINIPEGKYNLYESELSEPGTSFLGPVQFIIKKVEGQLKVYVLNNFSSQNIVIEQNGDNININIIHSKNSGGTDSNNLQKGCLEESTDGSISGLETSLKVEKEMYPPSNKDWKINLLVSANLYGKYYPLPLTDTEESYVTIESYCLYEHSERFSDYLKEHNSEYYKEYNDYITQKEEEYHQQYLNNLNQKYGDEYNEFMKNIQLEDYVINFYYFDFRDYLRRIYYYDYKDKKTKEYLEENYNDKYQKYLIDKYGQNYEKYNVDTIEEYWEKYYYDDYYDFTYHRLEDYFYEEYDNKEEYYDDFLQYIEDEYESYFKSWKNSYDIEEYCMKMYKIYFSDYYSEQDDYYADFEEYLLEFHPDAYDYDEFLQYLNDNYGDEYQEYRKTVKNNYELVTLSQKNGNVVELNTSKSWKTCLSPQNQDYFGKNLMIDIIEENNDNDNNKIIYSSNMDGLKQEGNRYYGTVNNAAGHEISVKVTNWDKNYGDLEISKKVFGLNGEEQIDREFDFNIILTAPDGVELADEYLFTKNGEDKQYKLLLSKVDNKANTSMGVISVKGGGSVRLIGLPVGTKYKIEEVQNSEFKVTAKNNEGVIPSADIADVLFTNTKAKTGLLTVTKKVVDSNKEKDKIRNKEFTFTVTLDDKKINGQYGEMEFKNGIATFTLKDGESKTAINIPEGIKYEVTEKAVNGYDVTKDGDKGTIEDGIEKKVVITNTKTILSPNTSDGILIAFIVIIISLGSLIYFQINKKALM